MGNELPTIDPRLVAEIQRSLVLAVRIVLNGKTSENSPPLSVNAKGMISPKLTPIPARLPLSSFTFSESAAADLPSKRNPCTKLKKVKSIVMMALPPTLPMTVSISTVVEMLSVLQFT